VIDNRLEIDGVRTQLIAAETDNVRLRAELDAAKRRLNALQTATGDRSADLQSMQSELTDSSGRIVVLSGLVALYERLDDVDLGDLVGSGLESVDGLFDELTADLPSVSDGLAAGRAALDEFEEQIPGVEGARLWLVTQFGRLHTFYDLTLDLLRDSVDNVGDFIQMLGDWFADVLRWIPFGSGEKAARVVESLTDLLSETAVTLAYADQNGTRALDQWVKREPETGEVALKGRLLRPLREQALAPAGALVDQAAAVGTTYKTSLAEPVRARLSERESVRQLIAAYRAQHNLENQA
jgi:hypothetical protein